MPAITISRLFGSGGSEVAERVAGALGWSHLDNAIVEAVAHRLGVTVAEVEAREERVPSLVERLADAMALGSQEWLAPVPDVALPPSDERLLEVTRRVITEGAAQGPIVVVGRGAQALLAERRDALHVLCYAPRPALVARVRRRTGLGAAEAERMVEETNRQREQYVRKHFGRAWLEHENYHLSVNTEWLGIDGAASAIVAVARERFRAEPPPGEERRR
jgi:cytidylate kinase